ncbi:WAT1-related protein At5g07050-like [Nymphaea colorata]|nr:WAT1-related protein At5g07050-like [Nymphaea colorata]XP_049935906.1 WAT1-related protein At5g07050-like [Nymphaea colorata]
MACLSSLDKFRPAAGMVLVQVFMTGMLLLSKLCLDEGMNIFALLAYRHLVAAAFLAPFAYFCDRDQVKRLTCAALGWIFVCALSGITIGMGFYYYGLLCTSTTFAATFLNLIPVLTFIFAVVLRMENICLKTRAGVVKVGGTVVCVMGAMLATLYKGTSVKLLSSLWHTHHTSAVRLAKTDWTRGAMMLVVSSISYSAWFIAQVKLFKMFPARYLANTLICLIGSLQSAVIGFALERDLAMWKIGPDLQLLTIVYSGVFTSGATFCLTSWCVSKKGPIYAAMFSPLLLVLACISGSIFLGERLYIGSMLGSVLIVGGLYAYLWGKRKESMLKILQVDGSGSASSRRLQAKAAVVVAQEAVVPDEANDQAKSEVAKGETAINLR